MENIRLSCLGEKMLQLKADPERNVYHELKNFIRIDINYQMLTIDDYFYWQSML